MSILEIYILHILNLNILKEWFKYKSTQLKYNSTYLQFLKMLSLQHLSIYILYSAKEELLIQGCYKWKLWSDRAEMHNLIWSEPLLGALQESYSNVTSSFTSEVSYLMLI